MTEQLQPIDLNTRPDLLPVVEEVEATRTPRHLQRNGQDVVVLQPAKPERRRSRHKQFSLDDSLFNIVGMARSEGPGDVATNHDKYLAEAYLNRHE
jgi:hypothetical protein